VLLEDLPIAVRPPISVSFITIWMSSAQSLRQALSSPC
jgi:hypothetical protein